MRLADRGMTASAWSVGPMTGRTGRRSRSRTSGRRCRGPALRRLTEMIRKAAGWFIDEIAEPPQRGRAVHVGAAGIAGRRGPAAGRHGAEGRDRDRRSQPVLRRRRPGHQGDLKGGLPDPDNRPVSLRHPDEILTDNGKVFTGRFGPQPVEVLFDRICRENGISHRHTAARSPASGSFAASPPTGSSRWMARCSPSATPSRPSWSTCSWTKPRSRSGARITSSRPSPEREEGGFEGSEPIACTSTGHKASSIRWNLTGGTGEKS